MYHGHISLGFRPAGSVELEIEDEEIVLKNVFLYGLSS